MGGQRGRLIDATNKIKAINLIQDANDNGCRINKACDALNISIRTLQRWKRAKTFVDKRCGPNTTPANKLSNEERERILKIANSPTYCNSSPSQIVPHLADQEIYIASESTFYRVLRAANQMQHRKASKPNIHNKPAELIALGPNQVWTWDITYLPSTILGIFYYLYLFLDIFHLK